MTASFVLNNQLRFQGSAAYGMVGIAAGAVLNVGLDPLLIFVLDMGVAGAALATILSQLASFCMLLLGCSRGGNLRIRLRNVCIRRDLLVEICKGGVPSLCRQGLASIATICLNRSAGLYGDAAIAAMSVVTRAMHAGPVGADRLRPGISAGVRLQLRRGAVWPGEGRLPLLRQVGHGVSGGSVGAGDDFRAPNRGGVPQRPGGYRLRGPGSAAVSARCSLCAGSSSSPAC